MRRLPAVLLLAALALAACSSDDDGDGADDGVDDVAAADAPFCDAFGALLTGPLADEGTDASDPAVLEGAVDETNLLLSDLIDAAPDGDVAGDAMALTADYQRTFAVLERYGYDLARVDAEATPDDQATLNNFAEGSSDPFDGIQGWVGDHCAPDITLPDDLNGTPDETTTTSP